MRAVLVRLAGAVVEFVGDGVEMLCGVDREVGASGEVLPQQPVSALVGR